jgi:DNA repair exonuclease SbcCD nuclease subunit
LTSITYPYAVIADVHCHDWSAFSHIHESGINNRLKHILDSIRLAARTVQLAGGKDLIIAGDLFHTRGSVKPSVQNPVYDLFQALCAEGIRVHAIPGNHDLEGKNSDQLGNALHTLSGISGFHCYTVPTVVDGSFLFIPWCENPQETLKIANEKVLSNPKLTLFCHVGLSGVIPANLGHTLNPDDFSEDFKYVFCGHFHNHVSFNSRVYSIGALTHQTWSDVGSTAGFLIVHEDKVEQFDSFAPKFIDVTSPPPKIARRGNYFRIKNVELPEEAAKELIKKLKDYGALGVIDQSTRPSLIEKSYEHDIDADLGTAKAIEAYCENTFGANAKEVIEECSRLMS